MFSLKEFEKITKGKFKNFIPVPRLRGVQAAAGITDFSTDTRTIKKGAVFVALKGENFDGHNFIRNAHVRGAVFCVVEKASGRDSKIPCLVVKDTLKAWGDLE